MLNNFVPVLDSLLSKNHITQKKFLEDINLSQTNYTKWRNGQTPNLETFCAIADYFGVSLDYLIGNEKEIKSTDYELLQDYNSIKPEYKNIIIANIKMFKELS